LSAMPAGDRKIPEPMVEPMSTATALKRPRRRGSREGTAAEDGMVRASIVHNTAAAAARHPARSSSRPSSRSSCRSSEAPTHFVHYSDISFRRHLLACSGVLRVRAGRHRPVSSSRARAAAGWQRVSVAADRGRVDDRARDHAGAGTRADVACAAFRTDVHDRTVRSCH